MNIGEVVEVGKLAGQVISKLLDQIPNDEKRMIRRYFEFIDKFKEESSRADADFDTLLAYKERKEALDESFINELRSSL